MTDIDTYSKVEELGRMFDDFCWENMRLDNIADRQCILVGFMRDVLGSDDSRLAGVYSRCVRHAVAIMALNRPRSEEA